MAELRNGVLRRVEIEATGGHHELQTILGAIYRAVDELRAEASRLAAPVGGLREPLRYIAPINLEGTIKVETEDDL